MTRGRTERGRERAERALLQTRAGRPLLRAVDHGPAVRLDGRVLGVVGDRWIDPFLVANRAYLRRVGVSAVVESHRDGLGLQLIPGPRVGAVPLLSPATRRVVAGLLVAPRFKWSALGSVLGELGFATEPSIGGTPLVPGSTREVPAWLIAAPVVRRLEALLRRRKRGFTERVELRESPRGRIDWARWVRTQAPSGQWTKLPCHFSEPDDDPSLMAAVRWTLGRLDDELSAFHDAAAARLLRARVLALQADVGPGEVRRPAFEVRPGVSAWIAEATQAMSWIAEERGLGGARVLDGMSWDLPVDELWEAWVDAFVAALAPRCGFVALRRGTTSRRLNWSTPTRSMGMLVPDSGLRADRRVVWVDAKYKAHLQLLVHRGWSGLEEATRDAHRADLHQALAYASLDDAERVDSVLVYPELAVEDAGRCAVATVAAGRRRVRMILLSLPFGFHSSTHRESTLTRWRELLAA